MIDMTKNLPASGTPSVPSGSALAQNRVLRNAYLLLSATVAFAGVAALFSSALGLPHPGLIVTLVGYFGLLFMVHKTASSAAGIGWTFALTGFMGYTLGPIISAYLALPNGPGIVAGAAGGTAALFVVLAGYAATSKRDFSALGPFLAIGALVAFGAALVGVFGSFPIVSLAASAMFVVVSSGMILWQVNSIVRGGEDNYVLATVTVFVSLFNLFTSLLHLLGMGGGDD